MWHNHYGLPVTYIGNKTIRFHMFQDYSGSPYKHKDMIRLGFYLYMGSYFKIYENNLVDKI